MQKLPQIQTQATFVKSLLIVAAAFALSAFEKDLSRRAPRPFEAQAPNREPLARQMERARELGRGREAVSPSHIPWKGWKDIFWRTHSRVSQSRLVAISAAVVFYGLLALFPAITALVSSYGLFAAPATIRGHLSFAAEMIPTDAFSVVQDQIARVLAKGEVKLSFAFVFGFGLALWSANSGMKAIIDALNVVYEEQEKRGLIRLNLLSLGFTACAIAAMLTAVGAVVITPLLLDRIGLGALTESIVRILRWPTLALGMLVGLAVLYRYGPSRHRARWEWLSVGAVFATVAWFVGSAALSYYLANYANYDVTYGSLGAAIGTMIWMWMSAIVILFGAALNSEIEHQTARDTTVGKEKPLGARGAIMADTVGAAQLL